MRDSTPKLVPVPEAPEDAARREAYAARHEAAERARVEEEERLEAAMPLTTVAARRVLRLQRQIKSQVRATPGLALRLYRSLPESVRESVFTAPARAAMRTYRKVKRPPKGDELPDYAAGPPSEEDAPRFRRMAHERNLFHPAPRPRPKGAYPKLCAIVLNRNGAHHLRTLFESFLDHNTYGPMEFIVVDHASTDDSRTILEGYERRLPLTTLYRDENFSFSHSNNRAAELTDADVLLFLNNDIIFSHDVLERAVRYFDDPRVGMVGLQLRYPALHDEHPSGLQHGGVKFYQDPDVAFYRPYNLGSRTGLRISGTEPEVLPAVTAAFALCRRRDFLALGGFSEDYVYGFEDVDLSLRVRTELGKLVVCAHELRAVHDESATQNRDPGPHVVERRRNNRGRLDRAFGLALRRAILADKLAGELFWTDKPLVVGFAVTEAQPGAKAGDYFTALELGTALAERFGFEVRYLSSTRDWFDVEGLDVLVAMVDRYDLTRLYHKKPTLLTVAWMRNWFDRWPERPWFERYDLLLCSSEQAVRYFAEAHGREAHLLRIGTNARRFGAGEPDPALAADVCFTGSNWRAPREIEAMLEPEALGGSLAVWGSGWEGHARLGGHARGFLPYERLPDVYASTKVVLDDANHVTKPWASVNSRVFDALAAGALVITNGEAGAREVFGDRLPTYTSREELTAEVQRQLTDEALRTRTAAALRAEVLREHTYDRRAEQLREILSTFTRERLRIAIKVPAPTPEVARIWGDYHLALGLRRAFWRLGHAVRIDLQADWERPERLGDDVTLVLRGLSRYIPDPKQVNLLWNISHPDKILAEEYEAYDHVFVASASYPAKLAHLSVPVTTLLQCTDPELFHRDEDPAGPHHEVLFVGNSRCQRRPVVMDAIEAKLPLALYGKLWEGLIDPSYLKGEHIPNEELRRAYSNAKIVLNDHWRSMRDEGFVSNRLFDAAACGALIVSDPAAGLREVFGDAVLTYGTVEELRALVQHYLVDEAARRARGEAVAQLIREQHTYARRAEEILKVAWALLERRVRGLDPGEPKSGEAVA